MECRAKYRGVEELVGAEHVLGVICYGGARQQKAVSSLSAEPMHGFSGVCCAVFEFMSLIAYYKVGFAVRK